jgi:hypothetical protein
MSQTDNAKSTQAPMTCEKCPQPAELYGFCRACLEKDALKYMAGWDAFFRRDRETPVLPLLREG